MKSEDWKTDVMILNLNRSSFNWKIYQLYQNKSVFENTTFYYEGQTYIGSEIFSIRP